MAAPAAAKLGKAEFISDVDAHMAGQQAEVKLLELQEQLRAYKQREQQLAMRRLRLQDRLPEIKSALEAVLGLLERSGSDEPLAADFELTEGIFAKAALQHVESVNLWLGANVMVEYPLAEARALLEANLAGCVDNLAALEADLADTKDNITITEVSMARVFNWDVEQRRKQKLAGGGGSS